MSRNLNTVEIIDSQNAIISIQAGVINELFQLLAQHISPDELDNLSCVARINQAAETRAGIE
ncbi:MAG: hypothetical protein PHV18_04200 [Lachnospiraceae bacterium]|nr:hypothetical protein [Lachnospiraceae bacterium]